MISWFMGSSPCIRFCAGSVEPTWDSLSPPLSLPLPCCPAHALSQNKLKKKKKSSLGRQRYWQSNRRPRLDRKVGGTENSAPAILHLWTTPCSGHLGAPGTEGGCGHLGWSQRCEEESSHPAEGRLNRTSGDSQRAGNSSGIRHPEWTPVF